MPQKPKHTAPPPNSQAAACGYKYASSSASHSVTLSHTMTKLKHSSLWITDASGNVNQYLAYTSTRLSTGLHFGELRCHPERSQRIDQRAKKHDIRFKFTGKERDAETGYTYFGARYYDSDLSVWLSACHPQLQRRRMDPLSDKYPSTSPFMYVRGNSIMVLGPNGMNEWIPPTKKGGDWTAEPGDSPGSLARDAGISQTAAEGVMRDYNKSKGNKRSSDIMVYTGDKVSIPGGGEESSGSSAANEASISTPSNASASSTGFIGPAQPDYVNTTSSNSSENINSSQCGSFNPGIGFSLSGGANVGMFGYSLSMGMFGGGPGTFSQIFLSIGLPPKENFFDDSVSAQLLFGTNTNNNWDLTGRGKTAGVGAFGVAGSYSTDSYVAPHYRIYGLGIGIGAKYTGGTVNTATMTLKFWWPLMFTPVGNKFKF